VVGRHFLHAVRIPFCCIVCDGSEAVWSLSIVQPVMLCCGGETERAGASDSGFTQSPSAEQRPDAAV